jgi:hypothetical protein
VWEDPSFRITGPPAQLGLISALTAHYPGGNPGDLSSDAKCAAYMRRMQREYVTDRGYSLGYNWMIPPNGTIWEARGILYVNAANGSSSWNARSFAVQFANGPGEALTDAQVQAARWLHGHLMALCDRSIAWNAHGQVRSQTWPTLAPPSQWSTQCPGALIWRALASGELEYRPLPPPIIVPPTEEEPVQVRYRDRRYLNIWLVGAAPALNLSGELDSYLAGKGIELVEGIHDQMLNGLLMQSGLSRADLVPA